VFPISSRCRLHRWYCSSLRSDDPWANHIVGMTPTPIEEGSDPLSLVASSSATQGQRPKRKAAEVARLQRQKSDSLEALWGTSRSEGDTSQDLGGRYTTAEVPSSSATSPNFISTECADTSKATNSDSEEEGEEGEEEDFVYPGGPSESTGPISEPQSLLTHTRIQSAPFSTVEAQQVEGAVNKTQGEAEIQESREPSSSSSATKPIDYAQLSLLCSQGPLNALQTFFNEATSSGPSGSNVSSFALANEPNPSSGLVPIHYAAREGKVEILKWLVKEAGALVEMEDREGEVSCHESKG
jgi:hypothetical protein